MESETLTHILTFRNFIHLFLRKLPDRLCWHFHRLKIHGCVSRRIVWHVFCGVNQKKPARKRFIFFLWHSERSQEPIMTGDTNPSPLIHQTCFIEDCGTLCFIYLLIFKHYFLLIFLFFSFYEIRQKGDQIRVGKEKWAGACLSHNRW